MAFRPNPERPPGAAGSGSPISSPEALRILAEASRVLANAQGDLASTFGAVTDVVAESLGDSCTLLLLSEDGRHLVHVARRHLDPEAQADADRVLERTPATLEGTLPGEVVRTGQALRLPVVDPRALVARAKPEYRPHLEKFPVHSLLLVPLRARGEALGVLVASRTKPGRPYGAEDEALLQELADRAALAIAQGRALDAERSTLERLARLQDLTSALASAMTGEEVARASVEIGRATLEAATGLLYLADPEGTLELVFQRGVPEAFLAEDLRRIPRNAPLPGAVVFRERRPVWVENLEQFEAHFPELAARMRRAGRGQALAVVPLLAEDECLGVLAFGYVGPRPFREPDRAFVSVLAHHAAQALFRARLLARERSYQARLRLLADAGALLASTFEYEATLRHVVELALPSLADFAFLDVVEGEPAEPEGARADLAVRRIPGAHEDPERLALLETTGWVRSERRDLNLCGLSSGRLGYHPRIDDAFRQAIAASPEHLALLRRLELCSMITTPLLSHGELLGALTLCFGPSGRHHGPEDVALAEELARRAAQAIRHARLYRSLEEATRRAEAAARAAEEASRLKDEFLTTVSHELRTPLSAILGWTAILRRREEARLDPLAKGLEVVERSARAQLSIVDDILDVSRIVRGQLRLDVSSVDLEAAALEALEAIHPSAASKRIEVAFQAGSSAKISGDAGRVRQILWNLLSNAVKFTPEGGRVSLEITRAGQDVRLVVRDSGVGIAPEFLPHVFDRFRQADGSTTRVHGGLGLGLAIVRHLTEMHGGTASVESEGPGKGSTFTLVLPAEPD